jgi:hypothetical protein
MLKCTLEVHLKLRSVVKKWTPVRYDKYVTWDLDTSGHYRETNKEITFFQRCLSNTSSSSKHWHQTDFNLWLLFADITGPTNVFIQLTSNQRLQHEASIFVSSCITLWPERKCHSSKNHGHQIAKAPTISEAHIVTCPTGMIYRISEAHTVT